MAYGKDTQHVEVKNVGCITFLLILAHKTALFVLVNGLVIIFAAMKDYFLSLFNYDKHASELIVNVILASDSNEKAVRLMSHLLGAQQVWYNRCTNQNAIGGAIWPDWEAGALLPIITENYVKWNSFLQGLDAAGFEKPITYTDSKGNPYSNRLSDILTHVINHGTHHRAQAGVYLKSDGAPLPLTDFIFYIRNLPNEK